ncbi:class I SAM-dependent methyltransferase [Marinitenerispora sediminis]|uniref:SAM-dependent methyltransferase n=1 Tax=Marinitenerispora sediminis TaxID=1931232 RepID=A0A368T057_9ACTN|nr:class I SAM-dependent methyltransferase [Marinitenerispora sediminis]RCV52049.1 SAM-dependent methyltransferase [Marinitenerispora sediminis]RCV54120.1 SAM-dependent methyltransferase [Marinitenerispora sediminis]RCV54361.1 SAM-dependent methyltransferase [Marinitenerispora sediminis]
MTYEHPLAYLLGLEGVALLRAFAGEHDRDFVEARIAEIRELLDDDSLADAAVAVDPVDAVEGYRVWSASYDDGRNPAFDLDEPVVGEILDALPAGVAVDAACGTGRYSAVLAGRGHRVIGVDGTPEMLARARTRVPGGTFLTGDLHRLPVAGAGADLVVCALALTHVPALGPVLAEFARVLRPGGHLILTDVHPERVLRGSNPSLRTPDGRPGRLPGYHHPIGSYLRAALSVGLHPLRCEEPAPPPRPPVPAPPPGERTPGPWDLWPWSLTDLVPEAARAADAGVPAMVVWHFRLAGS